VLAITVGAAAVSELRASDLAVASELRLGAARAVAGLVLERHERRHDGREEEDDDDHLTPGEAPELIVLTVRRGEAPVRAGGRPIPRGLPDQAALDAALAGEERWSERPIGGATVRLLSAPAWHDGRVVGAVQVGRALGEARRALSRSILILVLTGAAGLILAAGGSAFLAGRAMKPIGEALERQRRFLADASHELRTPVAVLRARAELLQREGAGPGARDELGRLRRDADELSALLDDLLDLARLDAGQEPLVLEPIALGEVAEEIAAQLTPLAEARGVTLTSRASPVWAKASLGRVRQVARALVDNAIKHTSEGGHVVVEADDDHGRPRLRVTDDGRGIAPADLPRVFDRFYRADPSRTGGGAGLGLSIAGRLVHLMGGEIRLDSAPGRGTTATVLFLSPARP